jgi:hypothetical protein
MGQLEILEIKYELCTYPNCGNLVGSKIKTYNYFTKITDLIWKFLAHLEQ